MFGYLNHMLNFANTNNMYTDGFAQMMNFNPFNMQSIFTKPKKKKKLPKKKMKEI